jgi:hypothetical protein
VTCFRFGRSIFVVGLVTLSGCEMLNFADHPKPVALPPAASAPEIQPDIPPKKPKPHVHIVRAEHRSAQEDEDFASQLTGLTEPEVRLLLGPPTAEEGRGPGKRWLYRNEHCVVAVSFYPDVDTRVFWSLSYEVMNDDNTDQGRRSCVAELEHRIGNGRDEKIGQD